MDCAVIEGRDGATVEFTRPGVSRLQVAADRFNLEAQLGFLLGAFSTRIEAEIEERLDALLAANAKPPARKTAAAKKKAWEGVNESNMPARLAQTRWSRTPPHASHAG